MNTPRFPVLLLVAVAGAGPRLVAAPEVFTPTEASALYATKVADPTPTPAAESDPVQLPVVNVTGGHLPAPPRLNVEEDSRAIREALERFAPGESARAEMIGRSTDAFFAARPGVGRNVPRAFEVDKDMALRAVAMVKAHGILGLFRAP